MGGNCYSMPTMIISDCYPGSNRPCCELGWEVFSFVWMPNHIHLFFRTPQPNLSKGMQYLLSGYANWYAKRHQRPGHLFQGRFKGELIEDDAYFWNVSRYLHLNPTRGKRPLAGNPRDWPWSSYRGYARKADRLEWVCYDSVYQAWQGEMGGSDAARAYRRFVESGLTEPPIKPPINPFSAAVEGFLLGSQVFVDRIKRLVKAPSHPDQVPQARKLLRRRREAIAAVANYYGVSPREYAGRRSRARGRDLAAYVAHRYTTATLRELAQEFGLSHPDSVYVAHRYTTATLRELAQEFGLSHPDSVSNLTGRAARALAESRSLQADLAAIMENLNT